MSVEYARKAQPRVHGKHFAQSVAVPTFRTVYKEQCDKLYVCSRRTLLSKIPDDTSLDLYVDIIRADEWKPLMQALRMDKSLEAISFRSSFMSTYPELIADVGRLQLVQKMQQIIRVPPLFTPENLKAFCSALSEHVKNNAVLRSLELIGFPFSLAHLQDLSLALLAISVDSWMQLKKTVSFPLKGAPFKQWHQLIFTTWLIPVRTRVWHHRGGDEMRQ